MTASAERPGHPGEVRVSDEPQQAARPQGRTRRLSGVCRRGDRAARDALSGWGRPRPARRGRTGGLQGQGVRARVRLPRRPATVWPSNWCVIRSASATTRNAATSRITPSTRSEKSRVEVFALDVARPVAIRKPERPPRIVDSWPRRGVRCCTPATLPFGCCRSVSPVPPRLRGLKDAGSVR